MRKVAISIKITSVAGADSFHVLSSDSSGCVNTQIAGQVPGKLFSVGFRVAAGVVTVAGRQSLTAASQNQETSIRSRGAKRHGKGSIAVFEFSW